MSEAAWRRRYRAPLTMFPAWARLRPDRLVYASNLPGRYEVFAWDRAADAHRQVTDRPEGTGYRVPGAIDPQGTRVWWWDDRKGDEFGTWAVDTFEAGEREEAGPLEPAYSAGLALGASFAVIGRSTEEEGATVDVVPARDRPLRVYRHREHAEVAGLSADERLFALSHSEHGDFLHHALRVLDLSGGKVAELWDGPGLRLEPGRWSPLEGDARLLVQHEREGQSRPLILDAVSGATLEIELDLLGEVRATDWYPDARSLLLVHDHRGRSELYRYFLADRSLQAFPVPPGCVDQARVRPDGEVWFQLNSSAAPPHARSLDGEVLRHASEVPEGVGYTGHDVGGAHVFLAEPREGARPRPTLFFVHGGPTAHDRDEWSPAVQTWVDHGFAVVMVNYRGSTGYGREWRDAIIGRPGLTELEDIATVHDWAVSSGLSERSRCVIGGGSWGGYLTLMGLGTQPERWAAGLAIVPVGDYFAAYEDEMEPLKRYDDALFGGTPSEIPEIYRRSDPMSYVANVRVPVFVMVGQNDPRCPSRSADNYIARLRELETPHEVYRYDAGHGSLVVDERIKQQELQIAFLAKHLGTTPPL